MKFDAEALAHTITVADGGWSTVLQARGAPLDQPAELTNLTHPHLVEKLARDYLAAGAQLLTTNTFACNRLVFERRAMQENPAEVARAGAAIARRVAGDRIPVLGAIGPCGLLLSVHERGSERAKDAFVEHAAALVEGGVDAILLETFYDLGEATLAIEAARKTGLPIVACMSFDSGPQRTATQVGVHADDAPAVLETAGADVVGVNCGAGFAFALPAVVALKSHTTRPLWVKPSAGPPDLEDGRPVYAYTPDELGHHVPALFEAGANVVGGCCGVGPEHVKRIAALAETHRRRHPSGARR